MRGRQNQAPLCICSYLALLRRHPGTGTISILPFHNLLGTSSVNTVKGLQAESVPSGSSLSRRFEVESIKTHIPMPY